MNWLGHIPDACPDCGNSDRFGVVGQQVSIDHRRMKIRLEHTIVACGGKLADGRPCGAAFDVSRAGLKRYRGQAPPADASRPVANDKPEDHATDTDLPRLFRR